MNLLIQVALNIVKHGRGGIFDSLGNIMGIHTRGSMLIGGKHHAGYSNKFITNTGINIINESIPNQIIK